ncbi:MAG: hypothetical protein M3P44_05915, partial [Actinomycetota bacterium]|nr:hypothetical protein [Actinomycetota bacterium]
MQLVVEVGLEPQDVAAGAVGGERRVALRELRGGSDVTGVLARQEGGADPAQLSVGDVGHGPFVEHVAPRQHAAHQS